MTTILLKRAELIAMISRIMNADGTEAELNELLIKLVEISPLPNVSDLIFYPKDDLSAEQIADAILNYKPDLFFPSQKQQ